MATYTAPQADLAKTVPGDREGNGKGKWQGGCLWKGEHRQFRGTRDTI